MYSKKKKKERERREEAKRANKGKKKGILWCLDLSATNGVNALDESNKGTIESSGTHS